MHKFDRVRQVAAMLPGDGAAIEKFSDFLS